MSRLSDGGDFADMRTVQDFSDSVREIAAKKSLGDVEPIRRLLDQAKTKVEMINEALLNGLDRNLELEYRLMDIRFFYKMIIDCLDFTSEDEARIEEIEQRVDTENKQLNDKGL